MLPVLTISISIVATAMLLIKRNKSAAAVPFLALNGIMLPLLHAVYYATRAGGELMFSTSNYYIAYSVLSGVSVLHFLLTSKNLRSHY